MHPDIEQDEAQGDQQKAISRVRRGSPAADLPRTAIAALDAEATPVLASCLVWRPVQMDQDEDYPVGPAWLASSALGRGEYPIDGQFGGERRAVFTVEGVAGAVTAVAPAQGTRPTPLPTDGAGNQGWLFPTRQIFHDRDPVEAAIQEQPFHSDSQPSQAREQVIENSDDVLARQHETHCHRDPYGLYHHIGRGDPVEARGAVFGPAAHPQAFVLRQLAVVRPVMQINGDLAGTAPYALRNLGRQCGVHTLRQGRQVFHA